MPLRSHKGAKTQQSWQNDSEGIIEADNAADEQFGYERTAEAIRQACEEGLSAEATIDKLLEDVAAFRGAAPQSDDMACAE